MSANASLLIESILQGLKTGQCGVVIRRHVLGLVTGAAAVTLVFLVMGWTASTWKEDVVKRSMSGVTLAPASGQGSAVYIRWGRTTCPEIDNELVYLGYAGGSHYTHTGNGANILCMPDHPEWGTYDDSVHLLSMVHGLEYQPLRNTFPFQSTNAAGGNALADHNIPCAVCRSTMRTTSLMIPAKKTCPDGWNPEYWGYLMSSHYEHKRSQYICVDAAPEGDEAGYRNEDGALMFSVEGRCGSLPCPPYVDARELTCVVCTR